MEKFIGALCCIMFCMVAYLALRNRKRRSYSDFRRPPHR